MSSTSTIPPNPAPEVIAKDLAELGSQRWLRVGKLLPLTLPPLIVSAAVSTYGAVMSARLHGLEVQQLLWTLAMLSSALATVAMILNWYTGRWHVVTLQRQIDHLVQTGRIEMLAPPTEGDLTSVVACLNVYIAHLKNTDARLRLQKKELDIQTRIAEAQKRCIETVVERIGEAVLITDAFDEVLLVNHAAKEIFGFALDSAYRQPIHLVIQNPAFVGLIKAMRRPEEPNQRVVRIVLNSDTAQPQVLRATMTRVVDLRGHVYGVVTVLRRAEAETAKTPPPSLQRSSDQNSPHRRPHPPI